MGGARWTTWCLKGLWGSHLGRRHNHYFVPLKWGCHTELPALWALVTGSKGLLQWVLRPHSMGRTEGFDKYLKEQPRQGFAGLTGGESELLFSTQWPPCCTARAWPRLLGQLSYFAGHCEDPGCQAVTQRTPHAMACGQQKPGPPPWLVCGARPGPRGPAGPDLHLDMVTVILSQLQTTPQRMQRLICTQRAACPNSLPTDELLL